MSTLKRCDRCGVVEKNSLNENVSGWAAVKVSAYRKDYCEACMESFAQWEKGS